MTAVTHYIRREQKDAHIKEWRGIKVDGLHVEDRLQVFQAAVDAVQVLVQLTPGHKTNTSVQVLENQAHLYVISFFLQLTLWLKNKTVAHERKNHKHVSF